MEKILWNLFQYAEAYSFLFVWIVVPLGFTAIYLYVQRASVSVSKEDELGATVHSLPETKTSPVVPGGDGVINRNEANA